MVQIGDLTTTDMRYKFADVLFDICQNYEYFFLLLYLGNKIKVSLIIKMFIYKDSKLRSSRTIL